MWTPPGVIGAYQQRRTVSSMLWTLHRWEGILCNSACSSLARAIAIVLLPRPLGPRNSQAPDAGRRRNAESTFLGRSKPMKSAMRVGRYFSVRDCGNAKGGVLIAHPPSLSGLTVLECSRLLFARHSRRTRLTWNRL